MKFFRPLLITLGSLLLIAVIAVGLALIPSVQTWVARSFAPATPALTLSLDHVAVGLDRTHIENLRVVQPGLVLTLPSADVEVNVLNAASGSVTIKRLVAKGWILDLSAPAPAPASVAKSPASPPLARAKTAVDDIFAQLQLPIDLSVDGVELSGEVILPEGRVQVAITGGGLSAGREGKWIFAADLVAPDTTQVAVRGELTAHLATARSLDQLGLRLTAVARGPKTPQGASVDLSLSASQTHEGESVAASVRSGSRELVQLALKRLDGNAPLTGTWKLDVTTAEATPFALGRALPDFVAKGQGLFSVDRTLTQATASGALDVSVDQLAALSPDLAALGRLGLSAGFDLALSDQSLRVKRCEVSLSADATQVAKVAAQQAIEFNRTTGTITGADLNAELLRIELDGIPLAWAKPFLGELSLSGQDLRGAFTVSAREGVLAMRPSKPLTLLNLSAAQAGRPLLHDLNVALNAQADYSPKHWSAEITQLVVTQANAPLLKLTAKATQGITTAQPLTASGTFEVALPALLAQPIAVGTVALSQGVARGEFGATVAADKTATLTLQLSDLVAANALAARLPTVALQIRADMDASGLINAQLPLVITQGVRRSDITLTTKALASGGGYNIQAQLGGETLHLDDLMSFAALAPRAPVAVPKTKPSEPVNEPAPTNPATTLPAPSLPVWAGLTGALKIDIKTLVYSKDLQVNAIAGSVKLTPYILTVDTLRAALSTGGQLQAGGGLQFNAQQPSPYALQADLALTGIDSAPLLRVFTPNRPSPIEGKFDLSAHLGGQAKTPAGFDASALTDLDLSGKKGALKVLSVKARSNAKTVGNVAFAAGLLGTALGMESTAKTADKVRASALVAQQLAAIPFDELKLAFSRDDQYNLAVKELTLNSPQIRLLGSGQITQQPGVPLIRQPLRIDLKLGAREPFVTNLRTLNLVGAENDAQGYAYLAEALKLDGTLQAIGTDQIERLIERAITN